MDKPTHTPPEPAFKLIWNDRLGDYSVSEPNIDNTDCYTHDQLIQAHAAGLAQGRSEAASKLEQAVARQIQPGFWPAPIEPTKAMLMAGAVVDVGPDEDGVYRDSTWLTALYRVMRDAHTAAD